MGRIRVECYDGNLVIEKEISDKLAYRLFHRLIPKTEEKKETTTTKPSEKDIEEAFM